jgi:hypothetical protein
VLKFAAAACADARCRRRAAAATTITAGIMGNLKPYASVSVGPAAADAELQLTAILNPLTREAQRLGQVRARQRGRAWPRVGMALPSALLQDPCSSSDARVLLLLLLPPPLPPL